VIALVAFVGFFHVHRVILLHGDGKAESAVPRANSSGSEAPLRSGLLSSEWCTSVLWGVGLNLTPLPYLLIWAILCPESPSRRTPSLVACQVLIVLWTLARILGASPFLETLQQYGLSPEVHSAQVTLFYSICGMNVLRLLLNCVFIRTLWTVNRLMHVGNACIGCACMARLWWLGMEPMWMLCPDIGVVSCWICCVCQLGYATSFHPANRQRLSRAFRSSCSLVIQGDQVPVVAYVACAACAAIMAVLYRRVGEAEA
jgi:hypothetical protein